MDVISCRPWNGRRSERVAGANRPLYAVQNKKKRPFLANYSKHGIYKSFFRCCRAATAAVNLANLFSLMQRQTNNNFATARPWLVVALVTLAAGVVSHALPDSWNATAMGVLFLGTTYFTSISSASSQQVRDAGLALGGLLETERVNVRRLIRDTLVALAYAGGAAALIFPIFWWGFVLYWHPSASFILRNPASWSDELLGQALVVALPEEAFYRGYLLTNLARPAQRQLKLLGVPVGMNLVWSSALFAAGHYVTEPNPARLAVFFPALIFGWLRLRSAGIGASVVFHMLCNVFASLLGSGYRLWQ